VVVKRGSNFLACSNAIAAGVVADKIARELREDDAIRRSAEAWRAVKEHPDRIALRTLPNGRPSE
jgi:hypothetical protein